MKKLTKIAFLTPGALFQEAIEILQHVAHPLHVCRSHVLQALRQGLQERVHSLLLQRLQQGSKIGAGLLVEEIVLLQPLESIPDVTRQGVELRRSEEHT